MIPLGMEIIFPHLLLYYLKGMTDSLKKRVTHINFLNLYFGVTLPLKNTIQLSNLSLLTLAK